MGWIQTVGYFVGCIWTVKSLTDRLDLDPAVVVLELTCPSHPTQSPLANNTCPQWGSIQGNLMAVPIPKFVVPPGALQAK